MRSPLLYLTTSLINKISDATTARPLLPDVHTATHTRALSVVVYPCMIGLTLLGFWLSLHLLDSFPIREDEAIYAYWALHGWQEDALFLTVWVDKPPLFLWVLGCAQHLFGASAAAGRWVNIAASALLIPVTAAIARRLWGLRAGLLAALLIALNPFTLSFAPTLYTDPLLVLMGMLALCMALQNQPLWAGIWLGAAIMTKQQGLLYIPLVTTAAIWSVWGQRRRLIQTLAWLAGGTMLLVLPILYWDTLRWHVAPSPWDLGRKSYGALQVLPATAWGERIDAWGELLWYLTASGWNWLLFALVFGWLCWKNQLKGHCDAIVGPVSYRTSHVSIRDLRLPFYPRRLKPAADRENMLKHVTVPHLHPRLKSHPDWNWFVAPLAVWGGGFLLLHISVSFQTWDRYLLPLAPIFALLVAWAFSRLLVQKPSWHVLVVGVTLLLLLFPPAFQASRGQLPIGSDHGAYAGLDDAIVWLQQQAAPQNEHGRKNTPIVLYHRSLGWHYRFYLYEQIRAGDIELRWFPSSVYLADNVHKTPHTPKYLLEPSWAPLPDLPLHLSMQQLHLERRLNAEQFVVWELTEPPTTFCSWCLCREEGIATNADNRPTFDVLVPIESTSPRMSLP